MIRILRQIFGYSVAFYRSLPAFFLKGQCRFQPSCSEYAAKAIQAYAPGKATVLILRRFLRCHPFSRGGWDPI